MDIQNDSSEIDPAYRLLALCARAEGHPLFYEQLKEQLIGFKVWKELPTQAELHGMAPLLWHHIQKSGFSIPPEIEQALRGSYIRQRYFTQAHTSVLLEITTLFEQAGIRALLLKGLGLAYQVYPDPALRPISDIDLLLNQEDILPALDLMAGAGFRVDTPRIPLGQFPWEVTADSPLCDGLRTHVELHYLGFRDKAIIDATPRYDEFAGFDSPPFPLVFEKSTVYVPDHFDNLIHLSRHFTRHLFAATADKPVPLKWMADIVSLVERYDAALDWEQLQQQNPHFINQLATFYSLTPIPENLQKVIPIRPGSPPMGVNKYPQGWPREAFFGRQVGFLRFLRQTFAPPSDWWLRLYYGIDERSVLWYRQVVYRWQILKRLFWVIVHKMAI